jgi:serine protease AprX
MRITRKVSIVLLLAFEILINFREIHDLARNNLENKIIPYHPSQNFVNLPQSQQLQNNQSNRMLEFQAIREKYNTGGKNITIAFLDTGIELRHESFQRFHNVIPFYDVYSPDLGLQWGNPGDVLGHGTHIASIALGDSDQFHGIAPKANCVMVKIFNQTHPRTTNKWNVIKGFDWLLSYYDTNPFQILSLSIGMSIDQNEPDILANYIQNFTKRGIVVVSSVGNDGVLGEHSIYSPGTSEFAISVGAYDQSTMEIYSKSGQGPTWANIVKPDLVAPGVNENGADMNNLTGYTKMTGTSIATPYVTGAVALLMQYGQNLNQPLLPSEIKTLLCLAAEESPSHPLIDPDFRYGWGILNLLPIFQNWASFNLSSHQQTYQDYGDTLWSINNGAELSFTAEKVSIQSVIVPARTSLFISINTSNYNLALVDGIIDETGIPSILSSSNSFSELGFNTNESRLCYLIIKGLSNENQETIQLIAFTKPSYLYFVFYGLGFLLIFCVLLGIFIITLKPSRLNKNSV